MSELLETVFTEAKQVVFVNKESQDDKLGIHALYPGFSQKKSPQQFSDISMFFRSFFKNIPTNRKPPLK